MALQSDRLLELVVTTYRLLKFAASEFIPLWDWSPFVALLSHPQVSLSFLLALILSLR
jgi:hypothetical protein